MLMLDELRKQRMSLIKSEPDEEFEDNNDPLAEFGYEPI